MPLGAQPRRARGTVERPYSALGLRLALAIFGLVICTAAAVLLFHVGLTVFGWAAVVLAAIAVPDMAVIVTRMRRGRQQSRTGPPGG
jgi:Flp pilus assembly protein TadB